MSNPIKSLLPTPLSMQFISNINALNKLPLPLYKFFIDCALSLKASTINVTDQNILTNILQRQKVTKQIGSQAINAVKLLENVNQKVLKLMRTSQPGEVQSNLENCQKYIGSVLTENTLIDQLKIAYLLETLASTVHKSLQSTLKTVQTKLGMVQWSIFNLKKANLSSSKQNSSTSGQQTDQQSRKLKSINKMYVKVSFDENFSSSQIQKLIGSSFDPNIDGVIQASIQQSEKSNSNKSKTFTLSLIDFRLFMQELEKVKNLNF